MKENLGGCTAGSDGDSPELRRYVTARASAMRAHIDRSSTALERFIDIGKQIAGSQIQMC